MNEARKKWFAVQTKPRQEELAKINYLRQGFTAYSPKVQKMRSHARKTELVLRPLFPGYIFLNLNAEEEDWIAIGNTKGAIGPVHFNEYYPPVPDWVIAGIKARENDSGFVPLKFFNDDILESGATVSVVLGDMELDGIFLNFQDEERVLVLLDILQRHIPVVTSLSKLKVA